MPAPQGNQFALGNNGGRPTLYREEYNDQVFKLCLLGATDEEIADFFEVAVDTINEWKKVHEVFSASIANGKQKADMEVANRLYNGTEDRTVFEQMAFKLKDVSWVDGKKIESERVEIVDIAKVIPADFRNQSFWLRNRQSKKWRDKTETGFTDADGNDLKSLPISFT